jgi:hypothetical protein
MTQCRTAIVLLGWYLLAPPMYWDTRSIDGKDQLIARVDFSAPLSRWEHRGSFDAASACQASAARIESRAQQAFEEHKASRQADSEKKEGMSQSLLNLRSE